MFAQFNYFELKLPVSVAQNCTHPGPCDADIAEARKLSYVKKQLAKLDPEKLVKELRDYGAWDTDELKDHNANLDRILWIASGNIVDEIYINN